MPPRIFTFDAKAASSQDVEKVVDHNGRDQIRIHDKATKLTLAGKGQFTDHLSRSLESNREQPLHNTVNV